MNSYQEFDNHQVEKLDSHRDLIAPVERLKSSHPSSELNLSDKPRIIQEGGKPHESDVSKDELTTRKAKGDKFALQMNAPIEEQERMISSLRNVTHLESIMSYMMYRNKFFQCLQLELYLYLVGFLLFFVFLRSYQLKDSKDAKLSTAVLPMMFIYILFLIKSLSSLMNNVEPKANWLRVLALSFYLLVILFLILAESFGYTSVLQVIGVLPLLVDLYRLFAQNAYFGIKTFYWKVIIRDCFVFIMCLNIHGKYLKWRDTFIILYALFVIDFCIIAFIVLKFIVFGTVALIKRSWPLFTKYCYHFEIFMVLTASFSILMLTVAIKWAGDLDHGTPQSEIGVDTIIKTVEAINFEINNELYMLTVQTVLLGTVIVHFSRWYPIKYQDMYKLRKSDPRQQILEKKGFIKKTKEAYVYRLKHGEALDIQKANKHNDDSADSDTLVGLLDKNMRHDYLCSRCKTRKSNLIIEPCLHFDMCLTC